MALPDVTALLVAHLGPLLDPVPVSSRVPRDRPDRFVQIRRIGGATATVQDRARMDVHTWGTDDVDAMTIALDARARIWALAGTDTLGPMTYQVSEFLSPRHDDDPQTGQGRVWSTYTLAVRADELIHRAPT